MSANAALGGLTAGLFQSLRGGDFWLALRDGFVGGAMSYVGRRITAEQFSGAGLAGRVVGGVGASIVSNASQGRGMLTQIVLPLALGRLYVNADTTLRARFKIDLPTTLATAYFALQSDDFDLSASLSSGLPVFITHVRFADGYWKGNQIAGVVRLSGNPADPAPDADKLAVLAHERIHVLQYDFAFQAWSAPYEAGLKKQLGAGAWASHMDFGVHLLPWQLANWLLPYSHRPWEHEAHFLSRVSSENR